MNLLPRRNPSHSSYGNSSSSALSVNLMSKPNHVSSTVASGLSPDMNQPSPASMPLPQNRDESFRSRRPTLPKINASLPYSASLLDERTPASATLSPVSTKSSSARTPRGASTRRIAKFAPQRPPSPELVNLDCAFPPFPGIAKDSKKDDKSKSHRDRHARSRPASPASSSSGSSKPLPRPGPPRRASSASSKQLPKFFERLPSIGRSRQKSISAKAGEVPSLLPTSTGDIPPVPTLGLAEREDKSAVQTTTTTPTTTTTATTTTITTTESKNGEDIPSSQPPIISANILFDEPQSIDIAVAKQPENETAEKASATFPLLRPRKDSVPSYKLKQPPPIDSTAFAPRVPPLRSTTMPDPSPKHDVAVNASNSLAQRRSQSASAITSDWLEIYLDEEPAPTPPLSFTSSLPETAHQTPIIPIGVADKGTPAILLSSALAASSRRDSHHPGSMDFAEEGKTGLGAPVVTEPLAMGKRESNVFQFGSEWNETLITLSSESETSGSIARRPSDLQFNRLSVDSASSYGSFDGQTASSSSSLPAPDEMSQKLGDGDLPAVEVPPGLQPRRRCDSPTDPLFIDGRLSPMPTDSPKAAKAAMLESTAVSTVESTAGLAEPPEIVAKQQQQPRRPVRKESLALSNGRKPFAGSKGICRGCSQPILAGEKSVVSGDGRLSGRYHKECMVCSTCKSPFLTAEFYVHADRPYCAHHYHELENSLCATCGKGIEGLYVETANVAGRGREKHHANCLKCTQCYVQLTEDYFELSGKVYCERDAFRIASAMWTQQGNSKTPARSSPLIREYICSSGEPSAMQKGTNFPERMITKVMTAT